MVIQAQKEQGLCTAIGLRGVDESQFAHHLRMGSGRVMRLELERRLLNIHSSTLRIVLPLEVSTAGEHSR